MRQKSLFSVALLVVALAVGCSSKVDDAGLVTTIKSQMFSDEQLKNASLQVTSTKGEVTLAGSVPSDAARYDAYKIATQTPGVVKVNDQMSVQSAETSAPPPEPLAETPSAPEPKPQPKPVHKSEPKPKHIDAHPEVADNIAQAPINPPPAPNAAPPPAPEAAPAPPPPQPKQVDVAAGTTLTIRMIDGIDSSVNQAGELFHASLDAPIVVGNEVVVSKGADVYVRLASATQSGHYTGKSELRLELVKLEYQGHSYPLVSGAYSLSGDSRGKNTAEKVGGGAALGALIGAIAGGGKGAAIGAGVGGAGGGVYQGVTKGKNVKVASETKLDFQLDQPISVTVRPHANN